MRRQRIEHFKLFEFKVSDEQEAERIMEKLLRAYEEDRTPLQWTLKKRLQDTVSEWFVEQRRCPIVHLNLSDKGYWYGAYDVKIEPHQLVCWVDSYN